jgi:hypothetical protein
METPTTDSQARAYLDLSFTPLRAAIDRGDVDEIARIVQQLKDDGHQALADIALDTATRALYPNGVGS